MKPTSTSTRIRNWSLLALSSKSMCSKQNYAPLVKNPTNPPVPLNPKKKQCMCKIEEIRVEDTFLTLWCRIADMVRAYVDNPSPEATLAIAEAQKVQEAYVVFRSLVWELRNNLMKKADVQQVEQLKGLLATRDHELGRPFSIIYSSLSNALLKPCS